MKKRFKLITTIASLCLAVALMAFGVYAATTASYKVGTTISFDIGKHLDGNITINAYLSDNQTTYAEGADAAATLTFAIKATDKAEDLVNVVKTLDGVTLTQETPYVIYEVVFAPANGVSADVEISAVSNTAAGEGFTVNDQKATGVDTAKTWAKANAETLTADDEGGAIEFTVTLTGK